MEYDFSAFISEGSEAAESYAVNADQLEYLLQALLRGINKQYSCDFELSKKDEVEYIEDKNPFNFDTVAAHIARIEGVPKTKAKKTGFVEYFIEQGRNKVFLFKLKFSEQFFPVHLKTDNRQTIISENIDDFYHAVGEVVKSPRFHLKLKRLKADREK